MENIASADREPSRGGREKPFMNWWWGSSFSYPYSDRMAMHSTAILVYGCIHWHISFIIYYHHMYNLLPNICPIVFLF